MRPWPLSLLVVVLGGVTAGIAARLALVGLHVSATEGFAAFGSYTAAAMAGGAAGSIVGGGLVHALGAARCARLSAGLAFLAQVAVVAAVAGSVDVALLLPLVALGHGGGTVLLVALRATVLAGASGDGADVGRRVSAAAAAGTIGGAAGGVAGSVVFAASPELLVVAGLCSVVLLLPPVLLAPCGGGSGSLVAGFAATARFLVRSWRPLVFTGVLCSLTLGPVANLTGIVRSSGGDAWTGPAVLAAGVAGALGARLVVRARHAQLTRPVLLGALGAVSLAVWAVPAVGGGLVVMAAAAGAAFHAAVTRVETTLVLRARPDEVGIAQGSATGVVNVGLAAGAALLPAAAGGAARAGSIGMQAGVAQLVLAAVAFTVVAVAVRELLARRDQLGALVAGTTLALAGARR